MSNDEKYVKRIADLLKMAESGDDDEARAAAQHAERLMARYGIDRAVAMSQAGTKNEAIVRKFVDLKGIYSKAFVIGYNTIGPVLNVQILVSGTGNTLRATVIGYESDVDNSITLFTSLMLQAQGSATKTLKNDWANYGNASEKFNYRRSHIVGFFEGARDRMENTRFQVFTETSGSELAVRDRMNDVADKVAEWYPELKMRRGMSVGNGYGSGVAAGRQAMTGESQLKQRGQISG